MSKDSAGIVICGGGYRYFANSWVLLQLLRRQGVKMPVELWLTEAEYSRQLENWLQPLDVRVRICAVRSGANAELPLHARWQWILKPWALLNSEFRDVLYLDADCYPVRNPEFLVEQGHVPFCFS